MAELPDKVTMHLELVPEDIPEGMSLPKCNDCGGALWKWSRDGAVVFCPRCYYGDTDSR